ncbi:DUF3991 and TOPRIM domain-containing protein [Clostridium saccharobutylicum]|uniref:DUF3991 domain-containing protein n=1 Tax=Clostridium saccharobutylicum TaxID=169679 RepID=A0A1S8MZ30_CLOSA|nr:DUF3991 and TOPRIM domain-containing protein [Clostridium saccharobutylicum]OOM09454.1 hypothetical protein CLOSAC_37350 [Clostridium saccharobutylicum]
MGLREKAKRVDLKTFLEKQGYTFIMESKNHYRCIQDNTLTVTYKYKDPIYFWFSRDQEGDIITWVRENITNNDYKEAIEYLAEGCEDIAYYIPQPKEKIENVDIDIKYSDNTKRVYAYLVKTRGIDPKIVNELIDNGSISEDDRHNVVFHHKDSSGKIKGADLTGTNTYKRFKGTVRNSNENYGFTIKVGSEPQSILIFEAAIDLLSYFSLNKDNLENCLLLSISGCEKIKMIKNYLDTNKGINIIFVCSDNDTAGSHCVSNIEVMYSAYEVIDNREELIKFDVKDFNELLLKKKQIANGKNKK